MIIEANWNIGRQGVGFGVSASVPRESISEADRIALECLGLKHLLQRVTEVDVVMGGFTTDRKEAKPNKEGKVVGEGPWRRKDYTRSEVPYSDSMAAKIQGLFGTLEFPDSTKEASHVLTGVTAVVGLAEGETKAPKFQREKAKFSEKESTTEGLEGWLKRFAGYEGPTHGEDGEYHPEALVKAKAAIDQFLKDNI